MVAYGVVAPLNRDGGQAYCQRAVSADLPKTGEAGYKSRGCGTWKLYEGSLHK